MTTPKW